MAETQRRGVVASRTKAEGRAGISASRQRPPAQPVSAFGKTGGRFLPGFFPGGSLISKRKRPQISRPKGVLFVIGDSSLRLSLPAWEFYGGGTWALPPFPYLIIHHLTLAEFIECDSFDFRVVEEQIVPSTLNESEASIRDQSLDLTLRHSCLSLENVLDVSLLRRNERQRKLRADSQPRGPLTRRAQLRGQDGKNDRGRPDQHHFSACRDSSRRVDYRPNHAESNGETANCAGAWSSLPSAGSGTHRASLAPCQSAENGTRPTSQVQLA